MIWPLEGIPPSLPPYEGSFGAIRKYDIHTGIDLYCPLGTSVLAMEDGVVVHVDLDFTGPGGGSPWWNTTGVVMVEGKTGVIAYGEITPAVSVGAEVKAGERIGVVDCPVLKKNKGKPMTMLHLELYKHGARDTVWWHHDEPQPESLLDPEVLFVRTFGPLKGCSVFPANSSRELAKIKEEKVWRAFLNYPNKEGLDVN